jgi:hypothetical protein
MRKAIAALTVIGALGMPAAASAANQRPYPKLPTNVAHAGSAIVAFKTPIQASGDQFAATAGTQAASSDIAALNSTLSQLKASSVKQLFTNIPADQLAQARAQAMAATGQYVTDFTQVYQISYDPQINSGDAANDLAQSKLISSAMPDWIFHKPTDPSKQSKSQRKAALKAMTRARAAAQPNPNAAALPKNAGYITDAQSYQDAASNNVTGAASMILKKFGQQPGQGENVTNISLGNVTNQSTQLINGQRYIVQGGYPRIPVWLSTENCTTNNGTQTCNVALDPSGTTQDNQGDFIEIDLDFSVMAPPPNGDARIANPAPAGNGQLLGEAYGANFRLINPKVNNTENFVGAFLGAGLLQTPKANTITASIGNGFSVGGFSDYFFEDEAIIHDVVTTLVQGADEFVSISAGDGQTDTQVAMNPNGLTEPTQVTTDPSLPVDIDDPDNFSNPNYSYGVTNEPHYVIDSGANDAAADTLNDVFNNSPFNSKLDNLVSHTQHTFETRWTGQQNFHTGNGTRTTVSAPGDNILIDAQIEDANGNPINPAADFPRLIGGSSASAPEVAGAAAVVRQAARLLGHPMSAVQIRSLLAGTGHQAPTPTFDLGGDVIGPSLDLTNAVQSLFSSAKANGTPSFTRMTVAQRKAALSPTDLRSAFYTDTPQDPVAGTATIDLSQGLVAPSSRTNETIGTTGDNLNAPITFGVDAAFQPKLNMQWTLNFNKLSVDVPNKYFDKGTPSLRLLPSEIWGLIGKPLTTNNDRVVTVTATNKATGTTISTDVTFKALAPAAATFQHAVPGSFKPVFTTGDKVKIDFDETGLKGADGVELIVSDIDRAVPQAFPDNNLDAHGRKYVQSGLAGTFKLDSSDFPHGVGTYGIALRGMKNGREVADSTSFWQPIRYAPVAYQVPATPKQEAAASLLNGTAPLFYEIADTEADGGSAQFEEQIDVRNVAGAKGAIIEFSRPTYDFTEAFFLTGNFTDANSFVNNFTNPLGDRLDSGDDFGDAGETTHVSVNGTHGFVVLDGNQLGLATIPAANCDATYQVRVFATDGKGNILGVASDGSVMAFLDFGKAGCDGS